MEFSPGYLAGKSVLITGGTGSIGREILFRVLDAGCEVARVFSRNEYAQYLLDKELKEAGYDGRYRMFLGNVRDQERLTRALEGVDIVFHCAALKHVSACEYNPFEAVKTNVLGTQNLVDAVLEVEAERMVSVSTDKAVSPTNTMGATKLLAERLVTSAQGYKGDRPTEFTVVRFGNVLASRGSVIPLFVRQIREGGPVTLTHPEMRRFFMSLPEAAELVLSAVQSSEGGRIFILKMPSVRITDLIDVLIEELAPETGHDPEEIEVEQIGMRPGEKLHEELLTAEESLLATEHEDYFVIDPLGAVQNREPGEGYSTRDRDPLDPDEIRAMLDQSGVLDDVPELLRSTST